jgi:hypothetical protein
LKIEDVLHLISFRRRHFPHLERQVRDLDDIASVAMVSGLIAYGWKIDELSTCQGLVAKKLSQYAGSSTLSQQQIQSCQPENIDDNRNGSVEADDIDPAISERPITHNSVAHGSSVGPCPIVGYATKPLQQSPVKHTCFMEPFRKGTSSKDVDCKSALRNTKSKP